MPSKSIYVATKNYFSMGKNQNKATAKAKKQKLPGKRFAFHFTPSTKHSHQTPPPLWPSSLNPSFSAGCKQIRRRSIHIGGISGTNNNIQCIIELQFFGDEMFTELRQAFAKSQSKVSSLRENQMKSSRKDFHHHCAISLWKTLRNEFEHI